MPVSIINGIVAYPPSEMYEMHHEASNTVSSSVESSKILAIIGIAVIMSCSFGIGLPLIKFARHQVQLRANIEFGSAFLS